MTQLLHTTFTTFYGNQIIGSYIKWSTDATTHTNKVITGDLTIDVTLNLYSLALSTVSGGQLDPASALT